MNRDFGVKLLESGMDQLVDERKFEVVVDT